MEWRDEGILLSARRHGETSVIIEVLTKAHGRHPGVVRGGASRKMAPILQPGAILSLDWSARLEEHLGNFRVDPLPARTAQIMSNRAALATLSSVTALISVSLAEREPHPWLYARTLELLTVLGASQDWPQLYAAWELALLRELGFGLDLTKCAGTGTTADLIWVSPKSGRAVSSEAGAPWSDKFLELPVFLRDGWESGDQAQPSDLAAGFRLTGWFLDKWLAPTLNQERLPSARARAVESIQRGLNPQPA
ncbi:DNA repair protein RecO [Amaricoccus tamworthensis]|uniref:DNA repair protein RecO n=1 Tax=Amaricoccus tamworthensis TaxID=57002 RepID=UPI003C799A0C